MSTPSCHEAMLTEKKREDTLFTVKTIQAKSVLNKSEIFDYCLNPLLMVPSDVFLDRIIAELSCPPDVSVFFCHTVFEYTL